MSGEAEVEMMRRAIRIAMNGRGLVEPNPMVGCVIAKNGRVIGEGYHARYGGPHAEPTALANCTESPRGATAYVTLEPCCHTDKKTPPCVPALIAAEIARVVIGCVDPNPDVNGKGADQLRAAGVAVELNVLEEEAKQLLSPFIAHVVYERPYVTLKWAETADGKIAGPGGKRLQISNASATKVVHEIRARSDAIVIGINTVLSDDPMLTARDIMGFRAPVRVVLDSKARLPMTSRLAQTATEHPVLVYCDDETTREDQNSVEKLESKGVEFAATPTRREGHLALWAILNDLHRRNVTHVLVEPGPNLAQSFFAESEFVDRVWVIRSPKRIDDPTALAAVGVPTDFVKTGEITVDDDVLSEFLNPASPVFFAAQPSADFVLAREQAR